ncbi:hypothetical protein HYV89_04785 [Candidatus Woesearchaeota archaeon]|nr:hypothetical protein [Candidatus Woesearchaeota archaeon]
MKEFFNPNKEKLIMFVILFGLSLIKNFSILSLGQCYDCPDKYGFPIPFYNAGGNFGPAGAYVDSGFSFSFMILNIIMVYIITCIIIKIYNKVRR